MQVEISSVELPFISLQYLLLLVLNQIGWTLLRFDPLLEPIEKFNQLCAKVVDHASLDVMLTSCDR